MCSQSSEVTEVQVTKRERVCMGQLDCKDNQQCNNSAAPQKSGRKWTRLKGVKEKMFTITPSQFIDFIDFGLRQVTSGANFLSPTFMPCHPAALLVAHLGDIATNQQPCIYTFDCSWLWRRLPHALHCRLWVPTGFAIREQIRRSSTG